MFTTLSVSGKSTPKQFQWNVGEDPPLTGCAVKDIGHPMHAGLIEGVTDTLTGTTGFTNMDTALEVEGFPEEQPRFDVRMHLTISPSAGTYENVLLFVPALIPFFFHWNVGEIPPLTGMAVNVTVVPAQTGFAEATIETLTGNPEFTIIVTGFDTAGFSEVHAALEVILHVITSPFTGI